MCREKPIPFFTILIASFILTMNMVKVSGQDVNPTNNDTIAIYPKTNDLTEISRKSTELNLKAKKLLRQAISEDELTILKIKNDQLLHIIDSLLIRETYININTLSSRNLMGKFNYWQQNLKKLNKQHSELESVYKDLNQSTKYLEKEREFWSSIDLMSQKEELEDAVYKRFEEMAVLIDTSLNTLDQKSITILKMIDAITSMELDSETLIDNIESVIFEKQQNIFATDQLSLLSLDYSNKQNWTIPESYLMYYSGNYVYLKNYLKHNIWLIVFHLIVIIILIILFTKINNLKLKFKGEETESEKKRFKIILSSPISSALIVGLFASIIIYPYRPLLFQDISRFIVTIPIAIVLLNILPKKFNPYVYAFGILVFLHIIFINLPEDHIVARLTLLLLSLIEIGTISYFIIQLRKQTDQKKNSSMYILGFSFFFLVMVIAGFLANLMGKVSFSIYVVEGVLGIALVIILISFSLVVINGLVVLLIDSDHSNKLNIIKHNRIKSKEKITRFFNVVASILFIYFLLNVFKVQISLFKGVSEFMLEERNIGSLEFTWGNIFAFFIVIYLSIVIANFIRTLLEEDILNKMKMKKGVPYTIALMVKYALVTVGIFIAVSAAGIPTNNLTVIIGAFGVGIGFGLQNIFNNLVSGLILLFERPIQIGDTIEVGELIGNVRSIGIRSSNVRTLDGAEIIVPNGNLISNDVVNWTLSDDMRRIELLVGVSYSSDPHKVKEVLLNIIRNHPDIESDPAPNVLFKNLGDSSLDFRMLFWTREFNQWIRIKSDVLFQVFDDLKAAGIEIPFPQRDLHVRSVDKNIPLKI